MTERSTSRRVLAGLATAVALFALPLLAAAQVEIRSERVKFAAGQSSAKIAAVIRGDETIDYVLGARAGQSMVVTLETDNASNYFNVTAPAADSALFIGSSAGSRFEGKAPVDGDYTVRVYLMRNAARRNERASYKIHFEITGAAAKP